MRESLKSLTSALAEASAKTRKPTVGPRGATPRPDRAGQRLVAAHFALDTVRALKMVAAEELVTMESLIAEGVEAVLRKRHKPIPASLVEKLSRDNARPVQDDVA